MAQITERGTFPDGTHVHLYKASGPAQLRPEGAPDDTKLSKDGEVKFTGVDEGERYILFAYVHGQPLQLRATGRSANDESAILTQPAPAADRLRLADGSFADEAPERVKKSELPPFEAAPNLSQTQIAGDVPQRSATTRGTAHPVDVDEPVPYRAQEDVPDDVLQMSDTETGRATELAVGPQRQEDVPKGTPQRSDTPTGVATVIPQGGPVDAQQEKESSRGKEMRGEPVRVATEPVEGGLVKAVKGASEEQSDKRQRKVVEDVRDAFENPPPPEVVQTPEGAPDVPEPSGLDAQGQPLDADVARAAGVEPADKPAEPIRRSKSKK